MTPQIKKGDMILVHEIWHPDPAREPEYGIVLKCNGEHPAAPRFLRNYVVRFSDGRRMLVWTDEILEVVK